MKTGYYNGIIYTGTGFAEAFIAEDGIFSCVGDNDTIRKQLADGDVSVDLQGRFVCAGFNDSHMHLLGYGSYLQKARLDEHTSSLKELLEYVRQFRKGNDIRWLQGRGWNQDFFTDVNRMPTRWDIDKVVNDVPVVLTRTCGHCLVVNSKALEELDIHDDVAPVTGGSVGRNEDGKLNGLFFDNAMDLIYDHIPVPDSKEIKKMILAAAEKLNSYGITSVQTDDYCYSRKVPYKNIDEAYRQLEAEGKLTVRVNQQCNFTDFKQLREFIEDGNMTGRGTDMFRTGPLKMLGDGSLGGRTAWLSIPYADDPSTCGFPLFTQNQMDEMIGYANRHGMQVAVHAIGDRCLDQVLDAIEKALDRYPRQDHRHGIVHCQISRKDQLERIRRLKLHVYAQSVFLDYDNHIVTERVGEKLAATSYSWKSLSDMGVMVSNGSDAPVEHPDVMKGIECVVTRTSLDGYGPYLPQQAFSIREAIDSFTVNGAYRSFEENKKGKIEKGYLADFVVLGSNPFETDKYKLHEIEIKAVYLGGRCVYGGI